MPARNTVKSIPETLQGGTWAADPEGITGDIYEQLLNDLQSAVMRANTTRPVPSLPSWWIVSTPSPEKSCSTRPAAPAAFSPVPFATCATVMSKRSKTNRPCNPDPVCATSSSLCWLRHCCDDRQSIFLYNV